MAKFNEYERARGAKGPEPADDDRRPGPFAINCHSTGTFQQKDFLTLLFLDFEKSRFIREGEEGLFITTLLLFCGRQKRIFQTNCVMSLLILI